MNQSCALGPIKWRGIRRHFPHLAAAMALAAVIAPVPRPGLADNIAGSIVEFPLPAGYTFPIYPQAITAGPDHAVWFNEMPSTTSGLFNGITTPHVIGSVTSTGVVTQHPLQPQLNGTSITAVDAPWGLTSDGTTLWYAMNSDLDAVGVVGRMTADGMDDQYVLDQVTSIGGMTLDANGQLWIGGQTVGSEAVDQFTPGPTVPYSPFQTGTTSQHAVSGHSGVTQLVLGPDHNIWFPLGSDGIGQMTPSGNATVYPGPSGMSVGLITAAPDRVWFAYGSANGVLTHIGFSTLDGHITAPFVTMPSTRPIQGLTTGPDGNIWFTSSAPDGHGAVWRVDLCKHAQSFTTNTTNTGTLNPGALTVGPDGNIWFADYANEAVGRLTVSAVPALPPCSSAHTARPVHRGGTSSATQAAPEAFARDRLPRPNRRA